MEKSLEKIENELSQHTLEDKETFKQISDKLQTIHDIQITNREILKQCLEEVKKTNGRVTSHDVAIAEMKSSNALLHQIVTQQHNQYEKWVIQQEKLREGEDERFVSKGDFSIIKSLVYGFAGLILVAVIGALISQVIIK